METTEHLTIDITGMTCAACSTRIEKVLNKQAGIEAQVNLTTEKANIDYDSDIVKPDAIISKIENLGYGVLEKKVEFDVYGMTCAACSTRIDKVLNKQAGIIEATVNLPNETATIKYHSGLISEADLIKKIQNLGYDAEEKVSKQDKETYKDEQVKRMRIKLIISAVLSVPLVITMLDHLFGIALPDIFMNPWFQMTLAAPVQFVIGWLK